MTSNSLISIAALHPESLREALAIKAPSDQSDHSFSYREGWDDALRAADHRIAATHNLADEGLAGAASDQPDSAVQSLLDWLGDAQLPGAPGVRIADEVAEVFARTGLATSNEMDWELLRRLIHEGRGHNTHNIGGYPWPYEVCGSCQDRADDYIATRAAIAIALAKEPPDETH